MKIPTKNLLTKNIMGIYHDTYTGNRAFICEGECIYYLTDDYYIPKKVTNCFKKGKSKYSEVRNFSLTDSFGVNPLDELSKKYFGPNQP